MKKIIILATVGALVLALGVLILALLPGQAKLLNEATYISDGKVDKANEGKIVILAGRLVPELPLIDPATEVTIPYFAAYRKTEIFSHILDTDFEYTWYERAWDPLKEHKGVNLEEFSSSKLIAPIMMGDYHIDPRIFQELETIEKWKDITEDDLGDYKLFIHKSKNDEKTYLSEDAYIPDEITDYKGCKWHDDEDKRRYSYEVYKSDEPLDFTIVGVQKGDWLMLDDDLDVSYIKKGIHNKDAFINDNVNSNSSIGTTLAAAGGLILANAAYFTIRMKNGRRRR